MQGKSINFFRPRGTTMRAEVRVITLVLLGWIIPIVGYQAWVYFVQKSSRGDLLSQWTFFNLPIHFWLTGQFLPLWFIILCVLFNFWMDRHAARTLDGSLRFRARSGEEKEK
jgi:putative solute:sodium symporter small subunit